MTSNADFIRPPRVAGSFYPAERKELDLLIDQLMVPVPNYSLNGSLMALIEPHAGYRYSGITAAFGYALLRNLSFDCIVIVSPSHREYFNGISVFPGKAYQTPFGILPVDRELAGKLADSDPIISLSMKGHGDEHAIEVQLPFLQKNLEAPTILPIVIGDQRKEYCFHLGELLGGILAGRKPLLIASSDLSHYYPSPAANALDAIAIGSITRFDPHTLMEDLEQNRTEACGGGPIVSVLTAAKALGADSVEILDHRTSGDVTGDHSSVVGYLSAAIYRKN